MTLELINVLIEQLWAKPSREHLLEVCFALQEWMGLNRAPENPGRLLEPVTMTLQKQLVPAPITSQPQLYRLSSKDDAITVRLAVLKKTKKDLLHLLVHKDPGFDSWQQTPDVLKATTKAPYFIHFVTTSAYDRLMIVINRGDQKRIVVLHRRFTNTQNFKILSRWKDISIRPKAEIADLLWSSTDIKEVNKQFYSFVKQRFDDLNAILRKQSANKLADNVVKQFAVRLIGRYIFCWFLKEKEIIHEDILSAKTIERTKDFYNRVLHRLFFDTLNTLAYPQRKLPSDIPEELIMHFGRIPYLNGGLFDLLEEDRLFPKPELNDWLVSFVKVLEQYDFTVDESSSTYQQVAIDPEMLGRIFENLLASINPETEKIANERKAFGAFYTPREIVDYMVNQSLKTYLETHLLEEEESEEPEAMMANEPQPHLFSHVEPKQLQLTATKTKSIRTERNKSIKERIEKLFDTGYESNPFGDKETQQIRKLLDEIKVIDPACGSGAFPIGVLHRLEELHEKLGTVKTQYELRRDMLSHNIYGVDIMPMGVEISRLRAWLSLVLVCEYKSTDIKHNFGIKPLPNLDFKFVAANSLIDSGYDEFVHNVNEWGSPTMMRLDGEIQKLESIRNNYFGSSASTDDKKSLVKEFNGTKNYIKTEFDSLKRKKGLNLGDFLSKIDDWDPFNDSKVSTFFSPAWMFGVNDGFDVVIGNPPYINISNLQDDLRRLYKEHFSVTKNKTDVFAFFIERSDSLLKENGVLTFIVSHTWKATTSFSRLRELIFTKFQLKAIVELDFGVFEAIVKPVIITLKHRSNDSYLIEVLDENFSVIKHIDVKEVLRSPDYVLDTTSSVLDQKLFKIIENSSVLLGNIIQFSRGIKTSDDQRFLNEKPFKKDSKKIFRGRNIKAYELNWNGEYIWYRPDLMKEKVGSLPHSKEFFEVPEKLITQRVNSSFQLLVAYDDAQNYFLDTTNVSSYKTWNKKISLKYLIALLNSNLLNYWYCSKFRMPTISSYELEAIPIKDISEKQQQPFIHLVNKILAAKKKNPTADTSELEKQIDVMVYHLYGLEYEEAKVIDGELREEDWEKYKL